MKSLVLSLLLFYSILGVAQSHISIVSATRGAAPVVCTAQARVVQDEVAALPQPTGWTYFVVCDDQSWLNLLRILDHLPLAGNTTYATTDLASRRTYFRGASLIAQEIGAPAPAFIVAHEIAHAYIGGKPGNTEEAADRLAQQWLAHRQQGVPGTPHFGFR